MSRSGERLRIEKVEQGSREIRIILDEPPSHRFVTAMKELNPAYRFPETDSTDTGYHDYFYIPFSNEVELLSLFQLAKAHVAEAPGRIPAIAARWRAEKLAMEQAARGSQDQFDALVRQAGLPVSGKGNSGCLVALFLALPVVFTVRF
jgi:hypothetical protein